MSSSSPRARDDLARADRSTSRRAAGLSWGSLEKCLAWYWITRERLQSPHTSQPRVEFDLQGGDLVAVPMGHVEGGRGGDIAETMATVSTIGKGLRLLQVADPVQHDLIVLSSRDGASLRDLAKRQNAHSSTVSVQLGRAEGFLSGFLRGAEILF